MKPLLLALGVVLAAVASAAPRDEGYRRGSPRVILYQHENFGGAAIALHPGDALDNLAGRSFDDGGSLNDRISSIRVEGGATLVVYEHARFQGHALRVTADVRDLTARLLPESVTANWNDRISSLRVEGRRTGGGPRGNPDLLIRRAYQDVLERDPDPSGLAHFRDLVVNQGWTDDRVRDHLRRSDEFRNEAAERIVRQAYRDLLGRDPDPGGLAHFRDNLLSKNWTGRDVREALKASEEYRRRQAGG